ncbi:hypothetical protein OESDEN_21128 [Oesophagostomum dentatum]|uniref:Uncharacterized protein n=1 Tax=Oesophagostomum dentatum TaxID=61180 RepID=A0A0B1S5S7_OESDE|nr:hypothetical protein OESDEN_21128 [Oesophagostomum dentatum]
MLGFHGFLRVSSGYYSYHCSGYVPVYQCCFWKIFENLRDWRALTCPWMIRSITFNTTVTISEFRTVAGRAGLFAAALTDIPYCRFRTYHPADPNAKLELSCYGNGIATQWCIRSGYLTS